MNKRFTGTIGIALSLAMGLAMMTGCTKGTYSGVVVDKDETLAPKTETAVQTEVASQTGENTTEDTYPWPEENDDEITTQVTEPVQQDTTTAVDTEASTEAPTEAPTEEPTQIVPTEGPQDVATPTSKPRYYDYPDYITFDQARDLYYSKQVEAARNEGRKVVYLTFDDGSTNLTQQVLDHLDAYGVEATFFVVGNYSTPEVAEEMYNKIMKQGSSLGFHTYTHSRANIYASEQAFKDDVFQMYQYVYDKTGFYPYLFRFPGGTSTSFSTREDMQNLFIPYVKSLGLIYYDWNAESGDGGGGLTADQIYDNVVSYVGKLDTSVVLMHDGQGHEPTVEALPRILNTIVKEWNCLVIPITKSTNPVQTQF